MMGRSRIGVVLGAAVVLALWAAAPAWAAPERLAADPEPGAELHEAPERVTLTFSEPLDAGSEIKVLDECRNQLDDGNTAIELNKMSTAIKKTPSGTYTVAYVASGVTGDAVASYEFTVLHAGPACDSGGGHGGHGGGGGGGDGGGHGGHGGGGGDGGGHGGHGSGDGGGSGDHSEMDHGSGGDHAGMGMGHDGDHKAKRKHGHDGKHGQHKGGKKDDGGLGPQAGPGLIEPPPLPVPSGTAVLGALTLASLFGALGGWVLRVSGKG